MGFSVKYTLFVLIIQLITKTLSQSEYGENYEYYEEADDEYYYFDENYDDGSGLQDRTTTQAPWRAW